MTCRPLALRITVTSLLNTRSSSTSISNFHPCISSLYSSPILLCHTLSIFNFYYTDSEHTKLNMKEIMKLLLILIMIFDSQNLKRLEEENKSLYTEGTYMLTARTCSLYGHAYLSLRGMQFICIPRKPKLCLKLKLKFRLSPNRQECCLLICWSVLENKSFHV